MEITPQRNQYSITYHVTGKIENDSIDFTLTCLADELYPERFDLYIWSLGPHKTALAVLREAVEKITGRLIRKLDMNAGNGHGDVIVDYVTESMPTGHN